MQLSIIIPVYNVEDYVEECLQSVSKLENIDYEIIIVNDGSKDNSISKVEKFIKEYTGNVVLVNKENGGLSSARNAGINVAKGEYIFFCDSDDFIIKDEFEKFFKQAFQDEVEIGYGDFKYLINGKIQTPDTSKKKTNKFKNDVTIYSGLEYGEKAFDRKNNHLNEEAWLTLVKRRFLLENGIFFKEGIYHEDTLFTYQLLCVAKRVKYYNNAYYIYRIRNGSIMTSVDEKIVNKRIIDRANIALSVFELKSKLEKQYCFIDCLIIDLIFHTVFKNNLKFYFDKKIIRSCKKLSFRAFVKKCLLCFKRKNMKFIRDDINA